VNAANLGRLWPLTVKNDPAEQGVPVRRQARANTLPLTAGFHAEAAPVLASISVRWFLVIEVLSWLITAGELSADEISSCQLEGSLAPGR